MVTKLSIEKQNKVDNLKNRLPLDWVQQFLVICETKLKKRYVRQNAYVILNNCKDSHPGWKVIEAIADKHEKALKQIA